MDESTIQHRVLETEARRQMKVAGQKKVQCSECPARVKIVDAEPVTRLIDGLFVWVCLSCWNTWDGKWLWNKSGHR